MGRETARQAAAQATEITGEVASSLKVDHELTGFLASSADTEGTLRFQHRVFDNAARQMRLVELGQFFIKLHKATLNHRG